MPTPVALDEHSELTLTKESLEYTQYRYTSQRDSTEASISLPQKSGKEEALEWCEILRNMIESQKRKERTKQKLLRERRFEEILNQEDETTDSDEEEDEFEIVQKPRSSMYFVCKTLKKYNIYTHIYICMTMTL